MKKVTVGISVGDINGIGLEVILKTLSHQKVLNMCIPVIYGSSKIVSYHKNIANLENFSFHSLKDAERLRNDQVNVVNCWQDTVNISLGQLTEEGGRFAYISLDKAVNDLKNGLIQALVTGPVNKKAMNLAQFPYTGHTEYLTHIFEKKESLMLMVNDGLRIGLVTNHLPIRDVAAAITKESVGRKIQMMERSLKTDFGIERPTIAVLGLNPHAGDEGLIGEEEETAIRPAIIEAKKKGIMVMGPYPADGFFGSGMYRKFDGILAMFHDQGLVPFKALSFGKGVNFTAGLPIVRTSPDHGTAYDLAGKNQADPSSFRQALFQAIDVTRNRIEHEELTANPLRRKKRSLEDSNATPDKKLLEENEGKQS